MKYRVTTCALASAAMALSGVAFAQQSNGEQTRTEARKNSQGPANANERGVEQSNENSVLKGGQSGGTDMQKQRGNSQGSTNASPQARERANQNSAVQAGMMVQDKDGKTLGKVKEVKRAPDGTVIAIIVVLVVQINGSTQITLTPGQFTIVAGVIVVTGITAPSGS